MYDADARLIADSYSADYVDWSIATIEGAPASINANGLVTYGNGGGRYRIRATSDDLPTCYDTLNLVVPKVDIEQDATNVCKTCGCSVTVNATSNSYSPGGYVWSSAPAGISGRGASITFIPRSLNPGTYTVFAKSAAHPECYDTCTVNVLNVEFNHNPVDNIIRGATPVPVTVTVTPSVAGAGVTFVPDNGNVTVAGAAPNITITGVGVGACTIKAMWDGCEVGSLPASVIENPDFLPAAGAVAAGAAPSIPVAGIPAWGLTWPENVTADITAGRDGGTWRVIITSATGNYSLQATLIAGCTEVTGPGGNTTSNNWANQVANLNSLNGPTWYMVAAVEAHEQVHADWFDDGFQKATVVDALELAIENLTTAAADQAAAITALRALPAFATSLTASRGNWLTEILVLAAGDHAAGGPCETAEHGVVDPMINAINVHATAQGW